MKDLDVHKKVAELIDADKPDYHPYWKRDQHMAMLARH